MASAFDLLIDPAVETAVETAVDPAVETAVDTAVDPAVDPAAASAFDTAVDPAVETAAASAFDTQQLPPPPPLDDSRVPPYNAGQEPEDVPERQWNFMGGALPDTEAARSNTTIHPLSEAVLQNFDLTSDVKSNRAAIEKVAAKAYPGLTKEVLADYSDDRLKAILDYPMLRKALQLDSATRERLAQNLEEAAIIRGDIPLMLSAEGAIETYARMRLPPEMRTPESMARQAREPSYWESLIMAPVSSTARAFWGLYGEYLSGQISRRAKSAGSPGDARYIAAGDAAVSEFARWELNVPPVLKPLAAPFEFVGKTGAAAAAALGSLFTNPEDSPELFRKSEKVLSDAIKELVAITEGIGKLPKPVRNLIDNLPKDKSVLQLDTLAYLTANPAATAMWATITSAESFPGILAGSVPTLLGQPAVGLGIMQAFTYSRENANINSPDLVKSILQSSNLNLRDVADRAEYARNTTPRAVAARAESERFRGVRASTISLTGLATIKGIGGLNSTRSMSLNLARATAVSMLSEGLGELSAGKLSTGNFNFQEAMLESALGMSPVTTVLELSAAGHADVLKRRNDTRIKDWLRGNEELSGIIAGIPVEKLDTASSILADRMAAEGTPDVYLSAENLLRFDQDGTAIETLGLTREEVERAAAEGQDVQIGAETFIRHILGKDGFDSLIAHTAFEEGALTPDEAEQAAEEGVKIEDVLKENVEKLLGPELSQSALNRLADDVEAIRSLVAEQIRATGRYDADKSDAFALLTASRYTARAVRIARETGQPVDAAAIFEADNLRIEGGTPKASAFTQEGGFEAYRKRVDPSGRTIPAEDRPNLRMGDMYGMLPKNAEIVGELDDVTLHRGENGDYYATAYNPDVGEQDVVGYIQGRENGTELAVVAEMQGKGIGSELQYLFRRENPLAPTGGLTEAGASRLESTYDRLAGEDMDPLEDAPDGAFDPASDNILYQDAPDGALEQARATVQDPEALGLTAEEATRINPIYRPEAMPTKRMGTNEKAAKWLEDQFDGEAITDFTEVLSEEQVDKLGRLTAAEAQLALESSGNAADWYSEAVLRAMDVAFIKYPMLQDDAAAAAAGFGTSSNARFAFTYIMAVTSQNLDVAANSVAADTAFSEMVESIKSGDYSMKKEWGTGDKQAAMGKNFEKFLPMLNAMPGDTSAERMTALDAVFRDSKTVREWEVEMKAAGIPYSPPGNTAKDAVVYGSSTLGPKIGNGFWQNLNGNFEPLTIDLWMRRTWGRLTGKSIGQPDAVPAQRSRLKSAILKSRSNEQGATDLIEMARSNLTSYEAALEAHKNSGQREGQTKKDFSAETRRLNKEVSEGNALLSDLAGLKAPEPWKAEYGKTDNALLAYSNRLMTAWSKEYKRLQEMYGSANIPTELQPTWARAAKAIKSNLSKPLDQIANGTQRKQVEAVGQRAREILSARGIDVTTADLQALLWYPEKELWGGLRNELEVDEDGIPVVTANSLNESYDTTFARIFRSQGYEVEGIAGDGAGGSGQGAIFGQDDRFVGPEGTAGTGQAGVQDNGSQEVLKQQRGAADPRGGFTPSDLITDQDGNPVNLLQIFEKADPTTFLHESGHFWLEQLKADALSVGGGFQQDFKVVTDWWGSRPLELREEAVRRAKKNKDKDSVAALQQMTEAQVSAYAKSGELRGEGPSRYISVAMHEQFARGVEDYFATARAPSLALGSIFSQFKVWVGSVYRRIAGLDVRFSPEVTGVVDRMLASDEEITVIEGQYNMAALLQNAEQAGLTPTQFAAYQKDVAEAKEARRAKQLSKTNRDHKRTLTTWWKDNEDAFRLEVEQELAALPAYRLLYTLTNQGLADGSVLSEDELISRMDQDILKDVLEAEGYSLEDMPKVDGEPVYMEQGELPAIVASVFGYDDVSSMVIELTDVAPYADAVEALVADKMAEAHGTFDAMYEAIDSVHIDKTAQVLAAELQALRTTEPAFKQKFLRQYAKDRLFETATKDIRPYKYIKTEKKHADMAGAALKRGDRTQAYKHQFHRLVNHYMSTEALKFQRDVEKKTKYMEGFSKRGKKFSSIEAEYVDVIKAIIKSVNFKSGAAGKMSRAEEIAALTTFIEVRQEQDGTLLSVPDFLLDPEINPNNNVRGMSYSRFLQLHEVIKRYETQGRKAKTARKGSEEIDRNLLVAELLSTIEATPPSIVSRFRAKSASEEDIFGYETVALLAGADAQLLKIEALLEAIDGSILGPWHQSIYEPFSEAAVDAQKLQLEVSDLIGSLIINLPKDIKKNFGKAINPTLLGGLGKPGMRITHGNLVMLALNSGNEGNLDKLIRGLGGDPDGISGTSVKGAEWNINEDMLNTAFEQLTEAEWSLIKAVWQHAEQLYPTIENIYRKEHGESPDRVVPRTVTTKFGDITGGYFPLMYDKTVPGASYDIVQRDALELMQAKEGRASVNASFTKARTGYAAPLTLDVSRIPSSFRNSIHFITHYSAVQNANKLLNDPDIRAAIEIKVGLPYYKELKAWLAALALNTNDTTDLGAWGGFFNGLYTNTTIAILGGSYSTLGMQTLGIINGQDRILADVGYTPKNMAMLQKDMAYGALKAADSQHAQWIMDLSGEMRFRRDNIDQNVNDALRGLKGKTSIVPVVQRGAMQAIGQVQFYTVDMPVWTAAYTTSLRTHPNDTGRAIKYADRVIRLSQSAGGLKDLSPIQRIAYLKPFLMFYTWFAAFYATQRAATADFASTITEKPATAIARAATRMFVLFAVTSLGVGLVRGKLPDWEEEDVDTGEGIHAMLAYIYKESLSTAVGSIPVLRDIAEGALSKFGYDGGAGVIAFKTMDDFRAMVAKEVPELFTENEDYIPENKRLQDAAKKLRPYVMLLGVLKGVPAIQTNRTLSGMAMLFDEDPLFNWTDIIRGAPNKEERARRELSR